MSAENEEQLDTEDTGVEVELDAEVESEESSEPQPAEAQPAPEGDELESYSQKVQGRIKKLTEERDREEAVTMAQRLLDENTKLKSQVKNLDKGYVNSEESRIKGQVAAVKQQYREAYD